MDFTFDFKNNMGDHLKVALSNYDKQIVEIFSKNPDILNIDFYNVSLERKVRNSKFLNPRILIDICDTLANFMFEHPNSVLTYLCDPVSEVERHNNNLSPQQYRSNLFSKLFEYYTISHRIEDFIDGIIHIEEKSTENGGIYAHFIYHKNLKPQIEVISKILLLDK